MNLNSPIPVRFGTATAERLKSVSAVSGVPAAQLIRLATERYLQDIEKKRSINIPVAPVSQNGKSGPLRKP